MKTAITTRFGCSCPLSDFFKMTLMFLTLIFQYLNELVEGEVRYFTPPQAFHAVKVQCLKHNDIKLFTKFTCQLPVKIFTVVADFPIQTCELPDTPPPPVRTFNFTRKRFIERPKFIQGLFQRLRVLDFLTGAKCQVCVFHTEICPNAFTCCRQWDKICVIRYEVKPIVAAIVTFDGDTPKFSMPSRVLMKRSWHFIKSPLPFIPLTKGECKKFKSSLFQRDRLKLMLRFDMGVTSAFIKEPLIRIINSFQLCLDGLAWQ